MFIERLHIFVYLMSFWCLFTGCDLSFFSVFSIALFLFAILKLMFVPSLSFRYSFGLFKYCVWLVREICISSIAVAKIIWTGDACSNAEIVEFRHGMQSDGLLTVLANSITLTPGTFTVQVSRDICYVHVLTSDFKRDLLSLSMTTKIRLLSKPTVSLL